MEQMGLQQELYGSHWTQPPSQERSEEQLSAQYHLFEETMVEDDIDLLSYQESDIQPAALSLYPLSPLGTVENPIVISDDEDNIDSSLNHPSHHEAQLTFTTPTLYLLHCQECVDHRHLYFKCLQYICNHMPQCTKYLIAHIIEASDFNPSGG
jgi:hypothetical protein